jgi:hypothetical protein
MKLASLGLFLLLAAPLPAQTGIPAGTILPVQLDTGLNTAKIKADQAVRATVMQSIPGTPFIAARTFWDTLSPSPVPAFQFGSTPLPRTDTDIL